MKGWTDPKRIAAALAVLAASLGILVATRGRDDATPTTGSDALDARDGRGPAERELAAPAAGGQRTEAGRTPDAPAGGTRDAATAVARSIEVRSSERVPLAFVELEVRERDWRRVDLDGGRCAVDPVALPLRVRAPGHGAAAVERAGSTVELVPDALLVVEGEGLAACLASLEPFPDLTRRDVDVDGRIRKEVASRVASGWRDGSSWALAATPGRLPWFAAEAGGVSVGAAWRDGRSARIALRVASGVRASWRPACETSGDLAPLEVALGRPRDAPRGEVAVRLSQRARSGAPEVVEAHAWGEIRLRPTADRSFERWVPAAADVARFESVPRDLAWFASAHEAGSGAVGATEFVHDGAQRTIELSPGIVIRGRLATADGSPLPRDVRLSWNDADSAGQSDYQYNHRRVDVRPDGAFETRGWADPPRDARDRLAPPARLELHCLAFGYEQVEEEVREVRTDGVCDVGTFVLRPLEPDLALPPGHELDAGELRFAVLRFAGPPARSFELSGAREGPRGELLLSLGVEERFGPRRERPADEDPEEEEEEELVFGDALVVVPARGTRAHAFERDAGSAWRRASVRRVALALDVRGAPAPDQAWSLTWTWRGVRVPAAWLSPQDLPARREIELIVPDAPVDLRWTPGRSLGREELGAAAGAIALDRDRVELSIP